MQSFQKKNKFQNILFSMQLPFAEFDSTKHITIRKIKLLINSKKFVYKMNKKKTEEDYIPQNLPTYDFSFYFCNTNIYGNFFNVLFIPFNFLAVLRRTPLRRHICGVKDLPCK